MPKLWPIRRVLYAGFLLLALSLTACAGNMSSTPLQEATWDAGRMCSTRYPLIQINQVEPDGRYRWVGRDGWTGSLQQFQACVGAERSKIVHAKATLKELVRNAYLTKVTPPNVVLTSGPPPTTDFKVDQPVIFYLERHKVGKVIEAKFKWYDPAGGVAFQNDRTLRESETGSGGWNWYTERLPSAQVQKPGAWALEVSFDDQIVGRYPFTVTE